jgi:hypothetical protein
MRASMTMRLSHTRDTPISGNVLANAADVEGATLGVTQFVVNGTPYTAAALRPSRASVA